MPVLTPRVHKKLCQLLPFSQGIISYFGALVKGEAGIKHLLFCPECSKIIAIN